MWIAKSHFLYVLAYRALNKAGKVDNEDFLVTYVVDLYHKAIESGVLDE